MPHIKNALIRYRVLDKCLRNPYKPYPSKLDLRYACEEALFGDSQGEHICDSTIEKDLFAMRMEHDAPIKYSKKHKGYYYTDPDFSINEIPLSEDDIDSIQFALSTLSQFRDTEIFRQFDFALNKIIDRINVSKESKTEDSEQFVQFETGNNMTGSEYLSPLLNAIKNQRTIYFDYASFVSGNKKRRKVTPLLLKEYRNRWYLISFDLVKEQVITYALDRMENLEISDQPGTKPKGFDPDLFFKHSIGITAGDKIAPAEVKFRAANVAAKYIDSQPFHSSQKIIEPGNQYTVFSLFVRVSEELIRELMSYGGELEVLEPQSLKEEIIDRINSMRSVYAIK
ncbi:MAG: WYL domain-containing protein [Brumimicrobium sp.]|nr:WYL domain-containing protein [Brumimicrobium sp.]